MDSNSSISNSAHSQPHHEISSQRTVRPGSAGAHGAWWRVARKICHEIVEQILDLGDTLPAVTWDSWLSRIERAEAEGSIEQLRGVLADINRWAARRARTPRR